MPHEIEQEIQDAYAKLSAEVKGTPDTVDKSNELPVAVRSSATAEDLPDASFAGQQDTYLNIRGGEQLMEHVKRCWASLWTAGAVTYRHKQGYEHDKVALAVVVQAMIESQVAGILFTANPVNHRLDQMVLNASWGLGEAIVSGLVTPDTWITYKDGEILEREIATKDIAIEYAAGGGTSEVAVPLDKCTIACLSDDEVRTLVALGERVRIITPARWILNGGIRARNSICCRRVRLPLYSRQKTVQRNRTATLMPHPPSLSLP